MLERLRRWLLAVPYNDPLERQQAALFQGIGLGLTGVALALLPVAALVALDLRRAGLFALLLLLVMLIGLGSIALARRGWLRLAALVMASALTLVLSAILYASTPGGGAVQVFAFALPIALGGLLADRRGLLIILGLSITGMGGAVMLREGRSPGAGLGSGQAGNALVGVIVFACVAVLLGVIIEGMRALTAEALAARRARERELETMSLRLESAVRERTADLEIALGALEQRAAEQARLLEENRRQDAAIRALSVPVLPLGDGTVVLPLVGELDDQRLATVTEQALAAVERLTARYLLLDITGVPVVDTHVAQGLLRALGAARLPGAEVALVGVRPEVAQAIVGLGIDLGAMAAFADIQSALARAAGARSTRN